MNGTAIPSSGYLDRLEEFRRSDRERDALVEEIIKNYEALRLRYDEKVDDYNNEVESRRMWQAKAKECQTSLAELKQASVSSKRVLPPRKSRLV
jgi:antirestriction protein